MDKLYIISNFFKTSKIDYYFGSLGSLKKLLLKATGEEIQIDLLVEILSLLEIPFTIITPTQDKYLEETIISWHSNN